MHILLRGRDIDNIKQLDVYERHGGFAGMKKALAMTPAEVIDVVKASGLRGRGGAGFPPASSGASSRSMSRSNT